MAILSKSNVPQFSVDVYQNEFLPEGGREVNAIVTVTSTGGGTTGARLLPGPAAATTDAGVVIMVDCSGSMEYPPTKMRNARDATAVAIDAIRDGVAFAVVAGTHQAREVFPANGGLAVADPATRAQAKQALRKLTAGGGTAIGTWLRLADRLLGASEVSIRHGILLTDGRNEHEKPEELQAALDLCSGSFTCDARGVGTDWEVKELTGIASALLGSVDIVADPAGLAADFRAMMENAMGKEIADVSLRLWTPQGSEIAFVKQVAPTVEDLTARRTVSGPRSGDYPTGSWGDESRDYHVAVRVPAAGIGQEMLAARLSLVLPQPDGSTHVLGQGLVRAVWTDDMAASTRISPQVAHYTGQAELAQVIQQGLEARKSGDMDGATAKLGRAVQLASASGNEDTAKLLAKVVDVVDAASGTVRLKARVADADEMTLEARSTKTVRVKK
ncbi:von Willebrand factor type A domain-containing protein [Streptomyces sp. DvalAA-14]|uniref:vWA domain-containing protein n=1 Tax=unclassified Streptomyces TaxID=2593676 RepID=UPI00081B3AC0|nr:MULTISPECIES: VWA domain-containing protein [unclassified Streptomyces]MYS19687.1 VWA domain-containing protein [Streptomyces sp. SID4948]SCD50653.1 von Willebrand factor type A domain-containing protein [Streptomyces sp. DvalAA-14]